MGRSATEISAANSAAQASFGSTRDPVVAIRVDLQKVRRFIGKKWQVS
jgi:hypothetical protein